MHIWLNGYRLCLWLHRGEMYLAHLTETGLSERRHPDYTCKCGEDLRRSGRSRPDQGSVACNCGASYPIKEN